MSEQEKQPALQIMNVTKTFGKKTAVDNVSFDPALPHKITYCFMPVVDSDYCTVVFYLDDQYVTQFTSADKVMYNVKWGSSFNTYLEVDKGGIGTLEKYEYSAPIDWGN